MPAPLVTVTVPVVPDPMVATIRVDVLLVIAVTTVPPIFTLAVVAPDKLVPFIIIEAPGHPLVEPKELIEGAACTVVVLSILPVPQEDVFQ